MDFLIYLFLAIPYILIGYYLLIQIYKHLHFELQYKIASLPSNLTWPIRKRYYMLQRFFYWGWNLRDSHDWDYSQLYAIMLLKMKRMHKAIENGSTEAACKKKILKSLKEAIKLCERLLEDNYTRNLDKVAKKWGEHEFAFNPSDTKGFSTMYSFNKNALNPKDQKKANEETMIAYTKDDFEQTMDRMRLFQVMQENIQKWWD